MALFLDSGTNKCQINYLQVNERVSLEIFGAFPEIIQDIPLVFHSKSLIVCKSGKKLSTFKPATTFPETSFIRLMRGIP